MPLLPIIEQPEMVKHESFCLITPSTMAQAPKSTPFGTERQVSGSNKGQGPGSYEVTPP